MFLTDARNAGLADLRDILVDQHGRKIDVVVPSERLRFNNGLLSISGADPLLGDDGVTDVNGFYRPSVIFDEGLAAKLGIPLTYLRRLRQERPDLLDANANGWLHGRREKWRTGSGGHEQIWDAIEPDSRSFLIRAFRTDDGQKGVARALLSDRYSVIDNLDVLTAALDGVRKAGVDVQIEGCDLTDRRMYVRVIAPEVKVWAEDLLKGYRSPFRDGGAERASVTLSQDGAVQQAQNSLGTINGTDPVLFAGFVISNSETGGGAFTITPRLVIEICQNGLTMTQDAMRSIHLGGRLEDGIVRWSQDTQDKTIDLITAKTRDAVETYLDVDYMKSVVDRLAEAGEVRVKDPAAAITAVGKKLSFDQTTIDGVLEHFILGSTLNAAGVMNAVTSYAQTVTDADKAHDLETKAVPALQAAASL